MGKKTSKFKAIMLIISIVLSVCSIIGGLTYAKYYHGKDSKGLTIARNFYFTSNLLDGKEHTFSSGTTSVTFTLGNHADDLRYSEMDITYNVEVDNGAVIDKSTGTLVKNVIKDDQITISSLTAGKTYHVKAVGKGKYTKTLTATIIIPDIITELYYYIDNSQSDYTLLTIWNEGDKAGNVTITYTGIPDNTLPHMSDWTTGNKVDVTINPHESKEFRFFTGTITIENATSKELN